MRSLVAPEAVDTQPRLSPTASTSSYDAAADPALALSVTADSFSTPWWSHFLQYFVAASLHTVPAGITLADSHSPQTLQPPSSRGSALNLVKQPPLDSSPHQSPFFGPPAPSPHQAALCFLQPPTLVHVLVTAIVPVLRLRLHLCEPTFTVPALRLWPQPCEPDHL